MMDVTRKIKGKWVVNLTTEEILMANLGEKNNRLAKLFWLERKKIINIAEENSLKIGQLRKKLGSIQDKIILSMPINHNSTRPLTDVGRKKNWLTTITVAEMETARLSEKQKKLAIMFWCENRTISEIARRVKVTTPSIFSNLEVIQSAILILRTFGLTAKTEPVDTHEKKIKTINKSRGGYGKKTEERKNKKPTTNNYAIKLRLTAQILGIAEKAIGDIKVVCEQAADEAEAMETTVDESKKEPELFFPEGLPPPRESVIKKIIEEPESDLITAKIIAAGKTLNAKKIKQKANKKKEKKPKLFLSSTLRKGEKSSTKKPDSSTAKNIFLVPDDIQAKKDFEAPEDQESEEFLDTEPPEEELAQIEQELEDGTFNNAPSETNFSNEYYEHPNFTANNKGGTGRRLISGGNGHKNHLVSLYLKEIQAYQLLTREEEIELGKRKNNGDQKAKLQLFQSNLRLVASIACKYQNRGLQYLDLIQEGNIGLMTAVDKYDHTRNFKFSTSAVWWIRQGIKRAVINKGKDIRLPVHIVTGINKIKRAQSILYKKLERTPTDEEIAVEMGQTVQIIRRYKTANIQKIISLSTPVGEDDDDNLGQFIADTTIESPEKTSKIKIDSDILWSIVTETFANDPKSLKVILLRFGISQGDIIQPISNANSIINIDQLSEVTATEKTMAAAKYAAKKTAIAVAEVVKAEDKVEKELTKQRRRKIKH